MSQISHVTYANGSCHSSHSHHTCEWICHYIHVTNGNELCDANSPNESCHIYEWVESLITFISPHVNESCQYINVTHEKESCHPNDSCHIYEWVVSLMTYHICEWVVSLYKCSTWEWVVSCKLFMLHECVVSRITYVTWLVPMCYIYICIHIHKRVDCRALRLYSVCIYLFICYLNRPTLFMYIFINIYL